MADNVYQLTISYNSAGQFAQNILHYKFDDGGFASTHAAALDLVSSFNTAKETLLRNMLPGSVLWLSTKARRVTNGGGFEAIEFFAPPVAGNRTGDMQVSGVAPVIISYPVDMTSRTRGRMFLPGVSVEDLVFGKYTAAYQAAAVTFNTDFFDDITLTGGGAPSAAFGIHKTTPANFVVLPSHRLSDTVGTMRRRQRPA